MSSTASKAVISELKRLAEQNGGVLQPESVVEAARPITSPLHNKFDWDDTEAAHKFRIWQARQLIRVSVQVIAGIGSPVDVFVSLTSDRSRDGGGYRTMVSVLSDKELRQQMLADALDELDTFREKYRDLVELVKVFSAIKNVRKK